MSKQPQAVNWIIEKSNTSSDGELVFNKTIPTRMLDEITTFVQLLPDDEKVVAYRPKFYLNWTDGANWYEITTVNGVLYNKAKYASGRTHIVFLSGKMD